MEIYSVFGVMYLQTDVVRSWCVVPSIMLQQSDTQITGQHVLILPVVKNAVDNNVIFLNYWIVASGKEWVSHLVCIVLSGIIARFFFFRASLRKLSRLLELFVFTGVRGLCTYRIEKKIYTSITRKISSAGLIDTIVKEKEILHVSIPVGCDVSPPPTGMETSTTLLRKP